MQDIATDQASLSRRGIALRFEFYKLALCVIILKRDSLPDQSAINAETGTDE